MAKKKGRYKYDSSGRDKTNTRMATQSAGGFDNFIKDGIPRYKTSPNNNLRLLPPGWLEDAKLKKKWGNFWAITIWVHTFIGPDNSNFLCPKKMLGKPCPICEARNDLDEEDGEEAKRKLSPGPRWLCYIIDRDEEKAGPQWFAMPSSKIGKELATRSKSKKTGRSLYIDDPENGYDFSFEKTGSGIKTQYVGVDIERDESPLSESSKRMDKWLEFIEDNPLPNILVYHDYEYMEKAYMGKGKKRRDEDDDEDDEDEDERDDEDEEDEEDDRKSKKGKKSKRRDRDEDDDDDDDDDRRKSKRRRDDEDEDDEDEDEDEEDEDEDEDDDDDRSSRKARKALKKSKSKKRRDEDEDDEDEDEDEEEEDDDDDEDDPPSKRSKSKKSKKRRDDEDDEDEDDD